MTCGLVHGSYSLPEWKAVKLTFFAPCSFCKLDERMEEISRRSCQKRSQKIRKGMYIFEFAEFLYFYYLFS